MKHIITACAVIAGVALAGAVHANEKLAQSTGCMTCHGVDKKIIGPAFKEIGAKYQGDKSIEDVLVKRVKAGSRGIWGSIPMPPNAHVKDEDIRSLVRWTLTLK